MTSVVFLALTALAGTEAPPPAPEPCVGRNADEVVVCGRRGDSPYRLPKLPDKYDRKRIRAETELIPGVKTSAHVDTVAMPDGRRSNRAMVTFAIPF